MRAFITGATGLLGSNLARQLIDQGHQVTALVRSKAKAATQFAGLDVDVVEGDMERVAAFAPQLDGHDVLFHTAAYFREAGAPGDHWPKLEQINVLGTMALLREAERRGIKKVIYVSSSGVIGGRPNGQPSDETVPPDDITFQSLYFKSKVVAEERLLEFLKTSALPVVQILPAWIYGPGDAAPTQAGQLVLDFINRRLPAEVDGYGSPVDVRDVAASMIAAVERGRSGERYIIGGDADYSFGQINAMLEEVSGVPRPALKLPYTAGLAVAFVMENIAKLTGKPTVVTVNGLRTIRLRRPLSSAKAQRELGVMPRLFVDTLRDTVAWYRANPIG